MVALEAQVAVVVGVLVVEEEVVVALAAVVVGILVVGVLEEAVAVALGVVEEVEVVEAQEGLEDLVASNANTESKQQTMHDFKQSKL